MKDAILCILFWAAFFGLANLIGSAVIGVVILVLMFTLPMWGLTKRGMQREIMADRLKEQKEEE
jgi:ABC-type transport system involved in cytochrome c biogenesis permease subunit